MYGSGKKHMSTRQANYLTISYFALYLLKLIRKFYIFVGGAEGPPQQIYKIFINITSPTGYFEKFFFGNMPCLGGLYRHLQGSLILVGTYIALTTSEIEYRHLGLRKNFYEKIQVQNSIFRPFSCASKLILQ